MPSKISSPSRGGPPRLAGPIKDWQVVAGALGGFAGALYPSGSAVMLALAGFGFVCFVLRFSNLSGVVFMVCAASVLAARSFSGLVAPVAIADNTRAVVLKDPEFEAGVVRVDLLVSGKHVLGYARGEAASRLRPAEVGDIAVVSGRMRGFFKSDAGLPVPRWALARHLSAQMTLEEVSELEPASGAEGVANHLRGLVAESADRALGKQRALFLGLVLGDDREQSAMLAAHFKVAGLTHLLAVSGQNIAFVLAVVAPVLGRFRRGLRLAVTVGIVGLFVLMVRAEPSVLRAASMAVASSFAIYRGSPQNPLRVLALVVCLWLLIDPLLAYSVGFQLSVAATAGIALFGESLTRSLRLGLLGPPVATTLAAQVLVAPILLANFGVVSLSSVAANLLVGPLAGFVMGWGMTVGMFASLAPRGVTALMMWPVKIVLSLIEALASFSAGLPIEPVRSLPVLCLLGIGLFAVWLLNARREASFLLIAVTAMAIGIFPQLESRGGSRVLDEGCQGASVVSSEGKTALVVEDVRNSEVECVVSELLFSQVRELEVLVITRQSSVQRRAIAPIVQAFDPVVILGPPGSAGHRFAREVAVVNPTRIVIGRQQMRVSSREDRLSIEVAEAGQPS